MATSKHFKTSKENQTAPVLNNASIYRAGQNPNQEDIVSDDEDENMVTNSYFLSEKLQSNQQPTFVDALKRRIDTSGRIVTRSQLLKTKKPPNKPTSPIKNPINNSTNSLTHSASSQPESHSNTNSQPISNENVSVSDASSDDSSDDFDMNNLDNLTVPAVEPSTKVMVTNNEADDIRQKLKQRLQLEKQQELQSAPIIIQSDNINIAQDSSSSSEYETASSSEDDPQQTQIDPRKRKIQFLSKKQRENAISLTLDEEAVILEELQHERSEKRKQETREYVLDYIRQQDKQKQDAEGDKSDEELPDDNDNDDCDMKEFELWKLREIRRNLRDENAREEREKEKYELLARRKMTDEEIVFENKRLGLNKEKKSGNMKFMQKYYHSGVFYRDGSIVESGVLDRNFNAPTGQDKYINFDKVPDAMKKKNFGKMSQSKWTHLANEDTTFDKQDREWFKKKKSGGLNDDERQKMNKDRYRFRHKANENNFWFNRAGTGSFDRPSYKNRNVNNSNNKRFEKKYHKNNNNNNTERDKDRDSDSDKRRRRRGRKTR